MLNQGFQVMLGDGWVWVSNKFPFSGEFYNTSEKEMATHSSAIAWRIPGTGKPGGLPSMGSHRVEHNWSDLAATAANSVQFSSVVSDSLWSHELQQARPPCPSPTPRVHPKSGPLSQWCHPAISSSVIPFSSCPQSLPASGSFLMSQLFTGGDVPLEKPICRSGSNS